MAVAIVLLVMLAVQLRPAGDHTSRQQVSSTVAPAPATEADLPPTIRAFRLWVQRTVEAGA